MYFQRTRSIRLLFTEVIIFWKKIIHLQSRRKGHFCLFFCLVTVENLPDLEKTCLRDTFHCTLFQIRICLLLLGRHQPDFGDRHRWPSPLLWLLPINKPGRPHEQPCFLTRDALASAALQVGLCLTPPSLNEQTLPFIRDTSKLHSPRAVMGMAFYHFSFFPTRVVPLPPAGQISLSCSILSGYTAPVLRLREQSLFHKQRNPYGESARLLKSEILPLFLLLTTGRLTSCPGNFQRHSQCEQTQQHSLAMQ